jgi:exopolysaccharide production protein ExoZ
MADRLNSIQYARAVAAVAVTTWHSIYWVSTGYHFLYRGQAGVDLFFVVSGFVMGHIGLGVRSPTKFLFRRALRIIPLYWVATVIAAVELNPTFSDFLMSLAFWPHARFPVLIQGWTLEYEIFFYIIFSLSLICPRHFIVVVTGLLTSLFFFGVITCPTSLPGKVYTNPLLFEFLAGVWLSVGWRRKCLPGGLWALFLLGAGLIAILIQPQAGAERTLRWGGPAVIIISGLLGLEASSALPRWRTLRLIGDSSYSIYLFHTPILSIIAPVVIGLRSPAAVTVAVASCIAGGVLVHKMLEDPLTRTLYRLTKGIHQSPIATRQMSGLTESTPPTS